MKIYSMLISRSMTLLFVYLLDFLLFYNSKLFCFDSRPLMMDFFLRTAWIMNILACSGPVLAVFMGLR